MSRPDFSRIWGSDNAPFTPIEASDYAAGWVFRTGAPPRRVNFDYFQNLSDQRSAWLGEQMLLTVGHEWQDDVTYDAYAITRSPVDGQIYRSLVGSNLNNEPSVSVAQWALGLASVPDASETVKGIIELATAAEVLAGVDAVRAVTPAGLAARLATTPFNKEYISPEQTITLSGSLTLTHGLGAAPKFMRNYAACVTAEGGYVPGDRVIFNPVDHQGSANGNGTMLIIENGNTTQISVKFGDQTFAGAFINRTTGAAFTPTPANWTISVGAWA